MLLSLARRANAAMARVAAPFFVILAIARKPFESSARFT